MQVYIGDSEVLDSGIIIAVEGQPIVFDVDGMFFKVHLLSDDEDQTTRTEQRLESKTTAELYCYNFNSTHLVGNQHALDVGATQGKDWARNISFLFRVVSMKSEPGKLLYYTWLKGPKQPPLENRGDNNE